MKIKHLLIGFILLFSVGCSSMNLIDKTDEMDLPEDGKANFYGYVMVDANAPAPERVVRLAKVYRGSENDGAFILDEGQSPSTISGEDGLFTFMNVEPGEYVLMVKKADGTYMVVADESKVPLIYEGSAGESVEIDSVIIID
jgi:hypothetical protein